MPDYIRNQVYGGIYFFTLVTHKRQPIFSDEVAANILMRAINQTQKREPFDLLAYCVLFDHVHLLIALTADDNSFSQKIRNIKRLTTKEIRSVLRKPELVIWQDRFWEHTIRDEEDLLHHFDYIHYNPAKHGYVEDFGDWAWSSYRWYYDVDPRNNEIDPTKFENCDCSFGE
jgi:putative transposase